MASYKKVGSGRYEILQKKSFTEQVSEFIGGMIGLFVIIGVLAAIFGD